MLLGVCVLVTVRLPRILAQAFIQQERQQLAMTVTPAREGVGESVVPQPVRAEGWWFCGPRQSAQSPHPPSSPRLDLQSLKTPQPQ